MLQIILHGAGSDVNELWGGRCSQVQASHKLLLSTRLYFGTAQTQGICVLSRQEHTLKVHYRGLYTTALDNFLVQIMSLILCSR